MKTVLIILILLINFSVFGQINVGSIEQVKLKKGEFEEGDFESLKNTKTIFVYRESDEENLETLKSVLKEAWEYTEMQFVSFEEFNENSYDEHYSFFTLGGYSKESTSTSNSMVVTNTHIYLTLWKEKDGEKLTYCRIEFFPTFATYEQTGKDEEYMINYLYNESILHNWNPVYLRNAFQFVSKKLKNSEGHWLFKSDVYTDLSVLRKSTLYIPDYTAIKFNPITTDESKRHNMEDMLKNYSFPYEVVSVDELSEIIKNSTKPIYYLSYIKSSSDKFISIMNGKTGDMLYSNYSGVSYNIKGKDFSKIAKAIK